MDADRFAARDNNEPVRVWPAVRALLSGTPHLPMPAQIEIASDQIMLGGRPVQDVAAEFHGDGKIWSVRKLDFRAPGTTRVSLSGAPAQDPADENFKAALNVESADPDALITWLQGRSDLAYRSQKPLRLRGDVTIAPNGFSLGGMKAELDGGAVEGRIAVSHRQPNSGARVEADLKAERLDLDTATALVRSLAGPQGEWPEEAQLSLDVGRAVSAGQELRPLVAKLGYGPKTITLEQLKIGQPGNVALEGTGQFDRVNATGNLALNSSAASFGQLTALIAPFAPSLTARLNAVAANPGPARAKLALDAREERRAGRPRQCPPRARPRYAAVHGCHDDHGAAARFRRSMASTSMRSAAATSWSRPNCHPGRARRCLRCSGSTASSRSARAPRASRGRPQAHGARRCRSRQNSPAQGWTPRRRAPPSRLRRSSRPTSI